MYVIEGFRTLSLRFVRVALSYVLIPRGQLICQRKRNDWIYTISLSVGTITCHIVLLYIENNDKETGQLIYSVSSLNHQNYGCSPSQDQG